MRSCCLPYLPSVVFLTILFKEIIQLGKNSRPLNAEYAVQNHKSKAALFQIIQSNIRVIVHQSFHWFVKYSYFGLTFYERMMTPAANVLFEVWRFFDGWLFQCHLLDQLESCSSAYPMMMEFEFVLVIHSLVSYEWFKLIK